MTLYVAFLREGNFRLPMLKFLGEILKRYGIQIYQVNALGLPWVTCDTPGKPGNHATYLASSVTTC
ncbi:hypothetical protein Hanom_Chr07g00621041 [Helianthus anomalus]